MAEEIRVATAWFDKEFSEELEKNGFRIPLVLGGGRGGGNLTKKLEKKDGKLLLKMRMLVHQDDRDVLGIPFSKIPVDVAKEIYTKYGKRFRMNFTRGFSSSIRSFDGWMTLEHHFFNQVDIFYQLFKNYEIDTVIIKNFPHIGADILILAAAEALGLRVIMSHQSHIPGRFWVSESIDDFGIFEKNTIADASYEHVISPPSPPFYMKQSVWKRSKLKAVLSVTNQVLHLLVRLIFIFPLFTSNFWSVRMHRIGLRLGRMQSTDPGRYIADKELKKSDLDGRKFVYFPLHLQPELTTEVLGGDYVDQLLAIEELASKLGPDFTIVVKENPKQTGYMRGREFYKRLGRIPTARYVDVSVSTYDLIQKSIGVATISGTAGWEALRMQKPVILFGISWYRGLPGVVQMNDPDFHAKFLDFQFDGERLKAAYKNVITKTMPGLVDIAYKSIIPNFDEKQLFLRTVESFAALIKSPRK